MNKELIILRHAKSDWNSKCTIDRGRPLNKRGKRDAQMIGNWMSKQKLIPDMVLCSPAKRAVKTLEHVLAAVNTEKIKVDYIESLYLAELSALLQLIHKTPESIQRLMLVGHNPGLEELVTYLSIQVVPSTDNGKILTTANLALLDIPDSFDLLQQHACNLHSLIRPKELRGLNGL